MRTSLEDLGESPNRPNRRPEQGSLQDQTSLPPFEKPGGRFPNPKREKWTPPKKQAARDPWVYPLHPDRGADLGRLPRGAGGLQRGVAGEPRIHWSKNLVEAIFV